MAAEQNLRTVWEDFIGQASHLTTLVSLSDEAFTETAQQLSKVLSHQLAQPPTTLADFAKRVVEVIECLFAIAEKAPSSHEGKLLHNQVLDMVRDVFEVEKQLLCLKHELVAIASEGEQLPVEAKLAVQKAIAKAEAELAEAVTSFGKLLSRFEARFNPPTIEGLLLHRAVESMISDPQNGPARALELARQLVPEEVSQEAGDNLAQLLWGALREKAPPRLRQAKPENVKAKLQALIREVLRARATVPVPSTYGNNSTVALFSPGPVKAPELETESEYSNRTKLYLAKIRPLLNQARFPFWDEDTLPAHAKVPQRVQEDLERWGHVFNTPTEAVAYILSNLNPRSLKAAVALGEMHLQRVRNKDVALRGALPELLHEMGLDWTNLSKEERKAWGESLLALNTFVPVAYYVPETGKVRQYLGHLWSIEVWKERGETPQFRALPGEVTAEALYGPRDNHLAFFTWPWWKLIDVRRQPYALAGLLHVCHRLYLCQEKNPKDPGYSIDLDQLTAMCAAKRMAAALEHDNLARLRMQVFGDIKEVGEERLGLIRVELREDKAHQRSRRSPGYTVYFKRGPNFLHPSRELQEKLTHPLPGATK